VHIRRGLAGVPHRRGLVKLAAHADSLQGELSDHHFPCTLEICKALIIALKHRENRSSLAEIEPNFSSENINCSDGLAGCTLDRDKGDSVSIHTRIRQFNTRDTYPEQNLDNDLCQAVIAGDTIYLRGQIGQDLDTSESVGVGDVAVQAEQAMTNIDQLLREAGSALQDIVKVTVYLVDPRYREPVYQVMGRWLKGVYPVSTGLVVSALARPEWLVEIDAIAVRPAAS
jgi:enamine deaminase RidA (YjgF/YER057c/UK114 family)